MQSSLHVNQSINNGALTFWSILYWSEPHTSELAGGMSVMHVICLYCAYITYVAVSVGYCAWLADKRQKVLGSMHFL